jgi:hypothetical protein
MSFVTQEYCCHRLFLLTLEQYPARETYTPLHLSLRVLYANGEILAFFRLTSLQMEFLYATS